MTVIAVNDIKVRMMVDTGTSVSEMGERLYDRTKKPTLQITEGQHSYPTEAANH